MIVRNPFRRSVDVPHEVLASARLGRGERVLAGAETADGAWLLGTRDAFYVVPVVHAGGDAASSQIRSSQPSAATRIPWQSIEHADWDREDERLVVSEVGEFGRVQPRHEFRMPEPGLLLDLVRERVTASVVLQRRVATHGKRGLLVIGRRAPTGHGEVLWAYQFDPGVDPEDPAVMVAAEAGLRAAQEELGM